MPRLIALRRARARLPEAAVVAVVSMLGISVIAARADVRLSPVVTSGLDTPVLVTAPEGDDRLFIVEKGGRIKVTSRQAGSPVSTFLDIRGIINTSGERGLLGLAFAPDFATSGAFYVNYIESGSVDTKIARYRVTGPNPNVADPTSGQVLLTVDQPPASTPFRTNHKGGWIGFRPGEPDNLYIATGDGGGSNDPEMSGQDLNDLLGKMLRIDVSGGTAGYSIPTDNPFAGATPGRDEIWAYGLRNPFRNSFDRKTGDFWIADVGQDLAEEVNVESADFTGGANYGWRLREGLSPTPSVGGAKPPGNVDPVFQYLHSAGIGGSITGGYVYRGGGAASELEGLYVFGDFVSGRIFSLDYDPSTPGAPVFDDLSSQLNSISLIGGGSLASFGEDGFGQLYVVDIGGQVYRIVPEPGAGLLAAVAAAVLMRRRRE